MVYIRHKSFMPKNGKIDQQAFIDQVKRLYGDQGLQLILQALEVLKNASVDEACSAKGHEMAAILIELHAGYSAVAAALLWPLFLKKKTDGLSVQEVLTQEVSQILLGVDKVSAIYGLHSHFKQPLSMDKLRKMLLAMINDVQVVLVKLSDRLVALRHADDLSSNEAMSLAKETLQVFAPLANRLGIWQLKWEMEDRAFRIKNPKAYDDIKSHLSERRVDREAYIRDLIESMNTCFAEIGLEAQVQGRAKHIYSIWRKMQKKDLKFSDLWDIRAIRVLLKDTRSCYEALSCIHQHFAPVSSEYEDYIAVPKANGYQSIHTIVYGPGEQVIEVQIRTYQMHEHSEMGVAAHWRYKEGVGHDANYEVRIQWLRSLLDWQHGMSEHDQKTQKSIDSRVYVMTPQGRVVDLPQGATSVDFAYHVHTDVGHRCRGAKVNGRMVPLNRALVTGDQVEIITGQESRPSRDWLQAEKGYVKTNRALSKVAHWYRQEARSDYIAQGKEAVARTLKQEKVSFSAWDHVLAHFSYQHLDDLWAAIGSHDVRLKQVTDVIFKVMDKEQPVDHRPESIEAEPSRASSSNSGAITIGGVDQLLTHLARCCRPILGDVVEGYITQSRGVTCHRVGCSVLESLKKQHPDRIMAVHWAQEVKGTFPVSLNVLAEERPHLLRDMTSHLAQQKVPLLSLKTSQRIKDKQQIVIHLTIEVANLGALKQFLAQFQKIAGVVKIARER